jgi:hypothetical protein
MELTETFSMSLSSKYSTKDGSTKLSHNQQIKQEEKLKNVLNVFELCLSNSV